MKGNPTFTVYVGPMFSSKTTKLLSALERFKYQRKRVAVFKPAIDDRYSTGEVVSHGGWATVATGVKVAADILEALAQMPDEPDVVAVDEAFMIPGITEVLVWLYRNGVSIVVATLDISSHGKPFPEIDRMLTWATHVEKCASVCVVCGRDAHYTHQKQVDDNDDVVVTGTEIRVGGSELYEPRCFSHHVAIDKRK